jgi:hypothetical protein
MHKENVVKEDKKRVKKSDKEKSSEKLHVEIAAGNWKKMEEYINGYNDSPNRVTPKIKIADVINQALVKYLGLEK